MARTKKPKRLDTIQIGGQVKRDIALSWHKFCALSGYPVWYCLQQAISRYMQNRSRDQKPLVSITALRQCYVQEQKYCRDETTNGLPRWKTIDHGICIFHQFGSDVDEDAKGTYTTAIIELPTGQLKNIAVHNIRFVNPTNMETQ